MESFHVGSKYRRVHNMYNLWCQKCLSRLAARRSRITTLALALLALPVLALAFAFEALRASALSAARALAPSLALAARAAAPAGRATDGLVGVEQPDLGGLIVEGQMRTAQARRSWRPLRDTAGPRPLAQDHSAS